MREQVLCFLPRSRHCAPPIGRPPTLNILSHHYHVHIFHPFFVSAYQLPVFILDPSLMVFHACVILKVFVAFPSLMMFQTSPRTPNLVWPFVKAAAMQ